ncbi:ATP-binding protein [Streptomyces sp. ISL-66]|uniref:AAA family ATPase n=1 Tax=Streptomyces sp. ISL-66 TaxID=2819186 RepID=UPI001BE684D3|nr:ATP-binding protein [Streptomyces sp. ISL-66]MBT2472708.1 ATP-binding protein [Streptomyces sp. ISL-66]
MLTAPRCVLFCGLPGSGKTTLALALAAHGVTRLCTDEEMFARYGRYGYDYPRGTFSVREKPVLAELRTRLSEVLAGGRDAVFDHGLWTRAERDEWRALVEDAGAVPVLVVFEVEHEELWRRIEAWNARDAANALQFAEHDLHRFAERYESPGADEEGGDPAQVLALLQGPAVVQEEGAG